MKLIIFLQARMGEWSSVDSDKLILRGLQFFGFHGVKTEEKRLGQKFLVDVNASLDLRAAGQTDSIDDTVSYTDIYRYVLLSSSFFFSLIWSEYDC